MFPGALRYSRPYTLCIEALYTLCCMPGDLRSRLRLVDQEFFLLEEDDFPDAEGLRKDYLDLKALIIRLDPKGDEGRITATISRSKLTTLEEAAQKIWDIHRKLSEYMNSDAS